MSRSNTFNRDRWRKCGACGTHVRRGDRPVRTAARVITFAVVLAATLGIAGLVMEIMAR